MDKGVELTQEARGRLQARRRQIGWSIRKASVYFGVEESTCRKRESGKTARIVPEERLTLFREFITGDYPQGLEDRRSSKHGGNNQTELERCLLLVSKTYSLLSWDKLLVEHYTNSLKETLRQVMELFLEEDYPARRRGCGE